MIAFKASYSSRSAFYLRLSGAADQDRLSVVAGVDAVRLADALGLRLAVAAGQRGDISPDL